MRQKKIIPLLAGVLLGVAAFQVASNSAKSFKADQAGLGLNTYSSNEYRKGNLVSATDAIDIKPAIIEAKKRGAKIALWLGASQLHAINQKKADDHLAIYYANQAARLRDSKTEYFQLSLPNGNLHDLMAIYFEVRSWNVTPDILILALVFDDLRDSAAQRLNRVHTFDPVTEKLAKPALTQLREVIQFKKEQVTKKATNKVQGIGVSNTPQELLENSIIKFLEQHWEAYSQRSTLAAKLEYLLVAGKQTIVQKGSNRRAPRVSLEKQNWSFKALEAIKNVAVYDKTNLILYQAPHRPSKGDFYHDRGSYDAFFKRVQSITTNSKVHFVSLMNIVPQEYWGQTNAGLPDVFHFQDAGHRILGKHIDSYINRTIERGKYALQ